MSDVFSTPEAISVARQSALKAKGLSETIFECLLQCHSAGPAAGPKLDAQDLSRIKTQLNSKKRLTSAIYRLSTVLSLMSPEQRRLVKKENMPIPSPCPSLTDPCSLHLPLRTFERVDLTIRKRLCLLNIKFSPTNIENHRAWAAATVAQERKEFHEKCEATKKENALQKTKRAAEKKDAALLKRARAEDKEKLRGTGNPSVLARKKRVRKARQSVLVSSSGSEEEGSPRATAGGTKGKRPPSAQPASPQAAPRPQASAPRPSAAAAAPPEPQPSAWKKSQKKKTKTSTRSKALARESAGSESDDETWQQGDDSDEELQLQDVYSKEFKESEASITRMNRSPVVAEDDDMYDGEDDHADDSDAAHGEPEPSPRKQVEVDLTAEGADAPSSQRAHDAPQKLSASKGKSGDLGKATAEAKVPDIRPKLEDTGTSPKKIPGAMVSPLRLRDEAKSHRGKMRSVGGRATAATVKDLISSGSDSDSSSCSLSSSVSTDPDTEEEEEQQGADGEGGAPYAQPESELAAGVSIRAAPSAETTKFASVIDNDKKRRAEDPELNTKISAEDIEFQKAQARRKRKMAMAKAVLEEQKERFALRKEEAKLKAEQLAFEQELEEAEKRAARAGHARAQAALERQEERKAAIALETKKKEEREQAAADSEARVAQETRDTLERVQAAEVKAKDKEMAEKAKAAQDKLKPEQIKKLQTGLARQSSLSSSGSANSDGTCDSLGGNHILPCKARPWSTLSTKQQRAALVIGFKAEGEDYSWDYYRSCWLKGKAELPPAFAHDCIEYLTEPLQKAMRALGITKEIFQCLSGNGIIANNSRIWERLSKTSQKHAHTLGINQRNKRATQVWNKLDAEGKCAEWSGLSAFTIKWDNLPQQQRAAAKALDWTHTTWNALRANIKAAGKARYLQQCEAKFQSSDEDENDAKDDDKDSSDSAAEPEPEAKRKGTMSSKTTEDKRSYLNAKGEISESDSDDEDWASRRKRAKKEERKKAKISEAEAGHGEMRPPSSKSSTASSEQGSDAAELELKNLKIKKKKDKKGKAEPTSPAASSVTSRSSSSTSGATSANALKIEFAINCSDRASYGFTVPATLKHNIDEELKGEVFYRSITGHNTLLKMYGLLTNHIDHAPARVTSKKLYGANQPWDLNLWLPASSTWVHSLKKGKASFSGGDMLIEDQKSKAENAVFTRKNQLITAIWTRALCQLRNPVKECQGFVPKNQFGYYLDYCFWLMTLASEYTLNAVCMLDQDLQTARGNGYWDYENVDVALRTLQRFDKMKLSQSSKQCLFCNGSGKLTLPATTTHETRALRTHTSKAVIRIHHERARACSITGHTYESCRENKSTKELPAACAEAVTDDLPEVCRNFNILSCTGCHLVRQRALPRHTRTSPLQNYILIRTVRAAHSRTNATTVATTTQSKTAPRSWPRARRRRARAGQHRTSQSRAAQQEAAEAGKLDADVAGVHTRRSPADLGGNAARSAIRGPATTRHTPTAPACSAHAVNPAPSSTDQYAVCVLAASWMGGGDLNSCVATSPTRTRNQLLKLGHRTVTCDLKKTFCDTKSFLTFSLAHTRTPSFSYGTVLTQATIIFQRRPPVQKRPTYMQLKPF